MKISAIITAGGNSNRFGSNKLLEDFEGVPLIVRTINKFRGLVDEIVIPATSIVKAEIEKYYSDIIFVQNGSCRQESVLNGLQKCKNPDYVLIHDGARPFVSKEIILKTIDEVQNLGAVAVGIRAIEEDIESINELLNWWVNPQYDYYNEWISETYNGLKKAGMIEDDPKTSGK